MNKQLRKEVADDIVSPELIELCNSTWTVLRRSLKIFPKMMKDTKVSDGKGPLYYSLLSKSDEDRWAELSDIEHNLRAAIGSDWRAEVPLKELPPNFLKDPEIINRLEEHGLLYLPYDYLVPGGRFDEMYGWDSSFGVRGCIESDNIELARCMTDNFIYEIEHYGTILNGNRSNYITRSNPPLLTAKILNVYRAAKNKDWKEVEPEGIYKTRNEWLESTVDAVIKHYHYWKDERRAAGDTGLSRYYANGRGPAAEVIVGEPEHYSHALKHFQAMYKKYHKLKKEGGDDGKQHKRKWLLSRSYNHEDGKLTDLYYKADRSMRASGFDPSHRWGYGNLCVIEYAPVCLNSLLYKMANETAEIFHILGNDAEAEAWHGEAAKCRQNMDKYLWDSENGCYFDYNFELDFHRQYDFATGFYPLYAKMFDKDNPNDLKKVEQIKDRMLDRLECKHGLMTSNKKSGSQWDKPYIWAPLVVIAVTALRNYNFHEDANRISKNFLSLIEKVRQETVSKASPLGQTFEKYNGEGKGSTKIKVKHGYSSNESENGVFLWTTSAVLILAKGLSEHG